MPSASRGPKLVRLQKFLADAGVASRRHAEELILEGHVLVNDAIVDELPAFIDPSSDRVIANGSVVRRHQSRHYIVNKPKGVVCSNRDPAGRPRAVDLLPPMKERLFVVGRLDTDSTGLLLMTNDGDLGEAIMHPRFGVPKVYRVEVDGRVEPDLPERMRKGVHLSVGRVSAEHVDIVHSGGLRSVLHITLAEGRNRQVRRMLARLGHRVRALKRLSIGSLSVRGLPVGACRPLAPRELAELRRAIEEGDTATPQRKRRSVRRSASATPGTVKKPKASPKKTAAAKPAATKVAKTRKRKTKKPPEPSTPRRRVIT